MSNYKHGDWYCKPANEEEAREIIARAVASGAGMKTRWNPDDRAFGVHNGVVSLDEEYGNEYTITQVRQKFPLPGEQPAGWSGECRPPLGWHGEVSWGKKDDWYECVVLPNGAIAYTANGHFWSTDNGHSERFDFRHLRTERERWVEQVCDLGPDDDSGDFRAFAEMIYDALKSGELKAPEVE